MLQHSPSSLRRRVPGMGAILVKAKHNADPRNMQSNHSRTNAAGEQEQRGALMPSATPPNVRWRSTRLSRLWQRATSSASSERVPSWDWGAVFYSGNLTLADALRERGSPSGHRSRLRQRAFCRGEPMPPKIGGAPPEHDALRERAPHLSLLSACTVAGVPCSIMPPAPWRWLVRVNASSAVLTSGIVLVAHPLMVLDLSGGLRAGAFRKTPAPYWMLGREHANKGLAKIPSTGALIQQAAASGGAHEHEEVFVCTHPHSSTFFHALVESAPRLLWALPYLRRRRIAVAARSTTLKDVLRVLGLRYAPFIGHGFAAAVFSRRVLVSPGSNLTWFPKFARQLTMAFGRALTASLPAARDERARSRSGMRGGRPARVVVLRRNNNASNKDPRALLNHGELLETLRGLFPGELIAEWPPPTSQSPGLAATAAALRAAQLVVGPHGGQMTNMLFAPSPAVVIELRASGRKGRVYGGLSSDLGHRYADCIYNASHPAFVPPAQVRRRTNFVVPMLWFLDCMHHKVSLAPNMTRGLAQEHLLAGDGWRRRLKGVLTSSEAQSHLSSLYTDLPPTWSPVWATGQKKNLSGPDCRELGYGTISSASPVVSLT